MLPLIFQSVQDFGMMSQQDFADLVALSQITPGPIAVNAATFVGYNYAGFVGAIVATFSVCFPAFIIMLLVMNFLEKFKNSRIVDSALYGIKPVTVGFIAAAVFFVADSVLVKGALLSRELLTEFMGYINLIPCCIFAVALVLSGKFKLNPILICIIAGITGALLCG